NHRLNQTQSITYSPRFHFSKYTSSYDFNVWTGPNYIINTSSLQKLVNNSGYGYHTAANYNLHLPAKFFTGSDADLLYVGKTQAFNTEFKKFIWNAYVGRSFLNDESLKLLLKGNDLLNQNTGYSRSGDDNNFTQNTYNTIKRNFLFAITWDFSKFSKIPEKK
ncbi:MAG: TonB-dependent receptor, partial [Mucilaginibacter sp.]|nr:TonB-dependent receptor [Mucilaginibacter sp.]